MGTIIWNWQRSYCYLKQTGKYNYKPKTSNSSRGREYYSAPSYCNVYSTKKPNSPNTTPSKPTSTPWAWSCSSVRLWSGHRTFMTMRSLQLRLSRYLLHCMRWGKSIVMSFVICWGRCWRKMIRKGRRLRRCMGRLGRFLIRRLRSWIWHWMKVFWWIRLGHMCEYYEYWGRKWDTRDSSILNSNE